MIGRAASALALAIAPLPVAVQGQVPSDPFLSVPAPQPRPAAPRPAPAQRPAQPAATVSGYPVPVGESFRDCAECPEMAVIPAGRFIMGSPRTEPGRFDNEGPQREVMISRPLAVGRFEVTFAEWDSCVAAGGCSHRPNDLGWGRDRQPVIGVSWNDAQGYVRWLSRRTGRSYRLLTEAEWEYAARAGTTTPYSFGATIRPHQANFSDGRVGRARPVGSYPANAWGLHDMHGNVWEWVIDCDAAGYSGALVDASQPVEQEGCSRRVIRGGSHVETSRSLRAAVRGASEPDASIVNAVGFRVARTPG